MALAMQSLTALVQRARAAFRAYLPGSDASLWPNNLYVMAKVIGASNEDLQGRLAFVAQQSRVSTATVDLPALAAQYGMAQKPAAPASGPAVITSTDALAVPAGTLFVRGDNVIYAASADVAMAGAGTLNVPLLALVAGKASLAEGGTVLTIGAGSSNAGGVGAAPSGPGLDSATVVVGPQGLTGGTDVEGIESLRQRVLFRLANPPRGGAPSDYVIWSTTVPGVTRVFVERLWNGPGSIRIFPIFDDLFAAQGGIPDVPHAETVVAALTPLVPAGADWTVSIAKPFPINVVIGNLAPLSTTVETAILSELADTFRRKGAVAGGDTPWPSMAFLATPQSFSRSWIGQAIANASGELRHVLVQPAADLTIPAGSLPVLGQVSFV